MAGSIVARTTLGAGRFRPFDGGGSAPSPTSGELNLPFPPLELVVPEPVGPTARDLVRLLDGGARAYPRMLEAIARARTTVHLEVYSFSPDGVGARFVDELVRAARRGVAVEVRIDGWGSAREGAGIVAALNAGGCVARIHNRLRALLVGRLGRNHRKVLLLDDEVAFIGGINIGDEYVSDSTREGWADVALEIRGPACGRLRKRIRRQRMGYEGPLHIELSGRGGGWRLRRRYLDAFAGARERISLAHGYFLPDRGVVRAISAAARRGVEVKLVLSGLSDVPFARVATRSLYRGLLAAGVQIYEWNRSVLHAKVATVDGTRLLLGSFNLDPFSLANLEALVTVDHPAAATRADDWIQERLAASTQVSSAGTSTWTRRWLVDPWGRVITRMASAMGHVVASRR